MSVLAQNIRFLRKQKGLTQAQLAEKVGLNRSVVAAYEEKRAEPRLQTLLLIAKYFDISLDDLVLKEQDGKQAPSSFDSDRSLRILPITVDGQSEEELITVVPVKAAAGYLDGYGDVDFIEALPQFSMPVREIPQDLTLRMFQVKGESMLPLPEGSYVLGSYEPNISSAGGGNPYIVVTAEEGIVFKKVENRIADNGTFRLVSENPDYPPYEVKAKDIIEMWKARAYLLFDLPEQGTALSGLRLAEITKSLGRIEKKLFE